jgi:hypothetical protein
MAFRLLILVFLVGCNPCKRLARKCPESVKIVHLVEYDTVKILTPSDTIKYASSMYDLFDLLGIKVVETTKDSAEVKIENEAQELTISRKEDEITIEAICKEDSLMEVIARLEADTSRFRTWEIEKYVPVVRNSKYHTVSGILAPVLLLFILFLIYLKLRI